MIDKDDLAMIFKFNAISEKVAFEEAIKELRKEYDPFNEYKLSSVEVKVSSTNFFCRT